MHQEDEQRQRAAQEMRRKVIGLSFEHDKQDIEFWRQASERVRGETLYELPARGEAIRASVPYTRQEKQRLILRDGGIEIQDIE